uniref:Uncharacterized protein n=1 Tax=Timema genevievae TaxID=629358 RepID=A0A7R9JPQ4_TIMGE|nr:unnamed protein product [Timema genevievae]
MINTAQQRTLANAPVVLSQTTEDGEIESPWLEFCLGAGPRNNSLDAEFMVVSKTKERLFLLKHVTSFGRYEQFRTCLILLLEAVPWYETIQKQLAEKRYPNAKIESKSNTQGLMRQSGTETDGYMRMGRKSSIEWYKETVGIHVIVRKVKSRNAGWGDGNAWSLLETKVILGKGIKDKLNAISSASRVVSRKNGCEHRHTTVHLTTSFVEETTESCKKKEITFTVLKEVKKAFDMVWHAGLPRKMIDFNFCKTIAKRRIHPPDQFIVLGEDIPFCNEIRYLSVIMDSRLNWKFHVENSRKRAMWVFVRNQGLFKSQSRETCRITVFPSQTGPLPPYNPQLYRHPRAENMIRYMNLRSTNSEISSAIQALKILQVVLSMWTQLLDKLRWTPSIRLSDNMLMAFPELFEEAQQLKELDYLGGIIASVLSHSSHPTDACQKQERKAKRASGKDVDINILPHIGGERLDMSTEDEKSCLLFLQHSGNILVGVYSHLRVERVENYFRKTTLSTPDRDSNLNLSVIGSLVYYKNSVLDHVATELGQN